MSFAVLGARVPGMRIGTPECVSKSYPTFFEQLQTLSAAGSVRPS
jgi:5-enolpyruvylshikimate-3-phosphate synthase